MVVGLTIRRRTTPLSIGSQHRPQTRSRSVVVVFVLLTTGTLVRGVTPQPGGHAAQVTGPPLRHQGSLRDRLRDGLRPPLTPEPLRPLTDQRQGQARGLPPGRAALARIRFCAKASRSHLAPLPDRGPHHRQQRAGILAAYTWVGINNAPTPRPQPARPVPSSSVPTGSHRKRKPSA